MVLNGVFCFYFKMFKKIFFHVISCAISEITSLNFLRKRTGIRQFFIVNLSEIDHKVLKFLFLFFLFKLICIGPQQFQDFLTKFTPCKCYILIF